MNGCMKDGHVFWRQRRYRTWGEATIRDDIGGMTLGIWVTVLSEMMMVQGWIVGGKPKLIWAIPK